MTKWKDTARAKMEIIKQNHSGEKIVIIEGTLLVIEQELPKEEFLVSDTVHNKLHRRKFRLKKDEIIIEEYGVTRDINIPMLLADGWDAQDLLRNRKLGNKS